MHVSIQVIEILSKDSLYLGLDEMKKCCSKLAQLAVEFEPTSVEIEPSEYNLKSEQIIEKLYLQHYNRIR